MTEQQTRVLYLGSGVESGDAGNVTVDWFRWIDRDRWAALMVTTEPSENRGLAAIEPHAEEVWDLPDMMPGGDFPEFILSLIERREVHVVHIMDSRLGFDLLPDTACLPQPPVVVVQLRDASGHPGYVRYVARRYANLVDAFSVTSERLREEVISHEVPPSRVEVTAAGGESAARRHEKLYTRLLSARPATSRWRSSELFGAETDSGTRLPDPQPPLSLPRSPAPPRSVGVIVPCFRHGIFLGECIDSIRAQTLEPARIVVVDDASDDPETIAALAELDGDPRIEILHQTENLGPSAARNRALEVLDTSYVLPIDADDKLLPNALERMVARLETAPAKTGFVYPHAQHFGNRSDFVRLPAYNLWLLMKENYCPAPALFDRRVFDAGGVRYPEDIVVGHEDWDLVLQLAEREIVGLHADGPTFLYRRLGFSRVNAVDYGPEEFHQAIAQRHPSLYDRSDEIKAAWAPAVSIILYDEGEGWGEADVAGLAEQTCADFEVLARTELADPVRTVGAGTPPGAEWLQLALDAARGRWVCVLEPSARMAFESRTFVEQMIYILSEPRQRFLIALSAEPPESRHFLGQLDDDERVLAEPIGIAFERRAAIAPPDVELSGTESLLAACVLGLQATGQVQWRVLPAAPGPASEAAAEAPGLASLRLGFDKSLDKSDFATKDLIAHEPPRLPQLALGTPRRWEESAGWTPPATTHLCRHRSLDGSHRMIANHRYSPPGYSLEFDLGLLHPNAAPGMRRLVYSNGSFELIDEQNMLDEKRHGLGYIEQEQLPGFERLELRRMPESGEITLVAGRHDPLFHVAEPVGDLGWIESFPINPQEPVVYTGPWRAVTLSRISEGDWRHRYTVGPEPDPGAVRLGLLCPDAGNGVVTLRRRRDGRLVTELARPGRASRDPRRAARWIAGDEGGGHSLRTAGGRLRHLASHLGDRRRSADPGDPLGGLQAQGGANLFPLYSTIHPVTGDQLVTCSPRDALARGYLADGILGYIHRAGNDPRDLG